MNKVGTIQKNERAQNVVFFLVILLVYLFLLWRCRYGYANIDENFYLTIPYRLVKGDALFAHEWHLSQMSAVILYPFVWIYTVLHGNLEGILLSMRYLCITVMCGTGLFLYVRLKKFHWLAAAVSSLAFVLYIPFCINALSYNSLGIVTLVISLVIMLTAEKRRDMQLIISGVFFALAVLCCPYLLLLYGFAGVAVLIKEIRRKLQPGMTVENSLVLDGREFFLVSAGCFLVAVIFFLFLFSRTSFSEFLAAIPQCLNDPEHPDTGIAWKFTQFFKSIFYGNAVKGYHSVLVALFVLCFFDKNRKNHSIIYYIAACCMVVILLFTYYEQDHYINHIMWPINLLAPLLFLLAESVVMKKIFCYVWIPGMIYSFCLHLASNQQFYAISSASTVTLVGSITMLVLFSLEMLRDEKRRAARAGIGIMLTIVLFTQISMEGILRYENVFWDTPIENQDTLIDVGMEKGIYATKERYGTYYNNLKNISILDKYPTENVLFLSEQTGLYLERFCEISAYSAWLSGVTDNTIVRLEAYYSMNADKIPEAVYVEKEYQEFGLKLNDYLNYAVDEYDSYLVLYKQDLK